MVRLPLDTLKLKWEAVLGRDLTKTEWVKTLSYPQKVSRNTRLKYIQFNYLHQTYLTPSRITTIYGGDPRPCPRFRILDADFIHVVWTCTVIEEYWRTVTSRVALTLHREVHCNIDTCLLGLFPRPNSEK